ncbi:hypothetical protein [Nannocystis punicea]|uniref:Uncharacterized protein n=1 Tax=Nannocystis punicea TaxID=2995304 RepID=A0ABY7GWM8_9BACT|nr:hypothetical protein [Nannocystis poenicansa]WAS91224.1 hypothetical protein O0S08_33975 [Nannocystis poenicansa]
MSARRLALACSLAGACTPLSPGLEDMEEPAPSEVGPVPKDSDHSGRTLQLAAVSDGPLTVTPLADRGVAVYGPGVLALALGGGPLESDGDWLRGWPHQWVFAVGGRWPDRAFLSAITEMSRTGMTYSVRSWRRRAWVESPPPGAAKMLEFYSDFAVASDGALLGLRGYTPPMFGEGAGDDASRRVTIDRLDDGSPPPWPPLPHGRGAEQLLTFADGSIVVVGIDPSFSPSLHRWSPGGRKWVELPRPPERGRPEVGDGPAVIVGRDPARLYAHRCLADAQPALDRLSERTWKPFPQPPGGCITSLAEAPDGTLWLVNKRGLFRRRPGPESTLWEAVPLEPVEVPGKPVAQVPGGPELPPPGPEPLSPQQVLALDRGELWLVATVGDPHTMPPRQVVLTTRMVILPLVLRPLSKWSG